MVCVWHPAFDSLHAAELDAYVREIQARKGFSIEQVGSSGEVEMYSFFPALGWLHQHQYDVSAALARCEQVQALSTDWTLSDKAMFEQQYEFHGKNFNRIHQMVSRQNE